MRCQWEAFISLVPLRLRESLDKLGKDHLQELRLRIGLPPELVLTRGSIWLDEIATKEDIYFCINAASKYSPWSASTVSQGYISAPGGHRLGVCGAVTLSNGQCTGISTATSLCIRVARDIPNVSKDLAERIGSVLLIGPPGSGKTTLLRDLIRQYSDAGPGCIAVVDERGELFPFAQQEPCFPTGKRTDILTGCSKEKGITMLIRCMGPAAIAVDEITAEEDCNALLTAGWCGVKIFATAHAADKDDLYSRQVYRPLLETRLFTTLVTLQQDKSWTMERMK